MLIFNDSIFAKKIKPITLGPSMYILSMEMHDLRGQVLQNLLERRCKRDQRCKHIYNKVCKIFFREDARRQLIGYPFNCVCCR